MSGWIKMRMGLRDDPTVFRLAKLTMLDRLAVIGRLCVFWSWIDAHAIEGRVHDACVVDVDTLCECNGFADALISVGWLECNDDGIYIPNHERHNGESAKERDMKNVRQSRWRRNVDGAPSTPPSTPPSHSKSATAEACTEASTASITSTATESTTSTAPSTQPSTQPSTDQSTPPSHEPAPSTSPSTQPSTPPSTVPSTPPSQTRLPDKIREEKRREEKETPTPSGRGRVSAGTVHGFPPGFERIWAAYPKKVGKDKAAHAFAKRKPDLAMVDAMVAAIEAQKSSEQWRKDGGQFIPHPATWLNDGRWLDEPSKASNDVPSDLAELFRRGAE